MFLRICSKNQLRQSISFIQNSLNNPFYNTNHQFSRTGPLAVVKRDFYSDLKVPRNAIQRQIKENYEAKAKLYQTELAAGVKDAAEKLKRLNQAYYVLGNVERKRLYDKGLTSFSKNLPEEVPVLSGSVKNTSKTEQKPILVNEKEFKEYLDRQVGDPHEMVSYIERKEAVKVATEVFATGDDLMEAPLYRQTKEPDTYTERALRKLAQKGKFTLR